MFFFVLICLLLRVHLLLVRRVALLLLFEAGLVHGLAAISRWGSGPKVKTSFAVPLPFLSGNA